MQEHEIRYRDGRTAFINKMKDETPHIIENAEYIAPDTRLDDARQDWQQIY